MSTNTYEKTGVDIDEDLFVKKRLNSLLAAALSSTMINNNKTLIDKNLIVIKQNGDRVSDAGAEWICSVLSQDTINTTRDIKCYIITDKNKQYLGTLNSERKKETDTSYINLKTDAKTYSDILLRLFRILQYNVFNLTVEGKGDNQRLTSSTKGIQIDKLINDRESVGNETIEKVSYVTKELVNIDNIYIQSLLKDDIIKNIYTAPIVCSYIKEKDL